MDTLTTSLDDAAPESWTDFARGEHVTLQHPAGMRLCGVLDMRTDDASVLWIQLHDGGGRRLVHRADGYHLSRG
ncbi:hypothetical protein AC792_06105 [Arthrobacter sp. RIT-PI-e]|uniref:hypothetical protein n=1 Tax=Arthrobacter sp. RIT-PI-e TaxID=1681197 RepID=UPI0006766A12|nr:hypothetical protein [Arthrobacter sp. RIT-PI-e]KNC19427.1 hypothetical protein AC792_06105 [Arthrobacter sp. RIT-PI-e]